MSSQEDEVETVTAAQSSAVRGVWGDPDDAPAPLDHPVPVIDFPSFHTPAPPDLDLFNEQWERNPMSRGCYVTYVTIYDPAKGKKLELPVTVCN